MFLNNQLALIVFYFALEFSIVFVTVNDHKGQRNSDLKAKGGRHKTNSPLVPKWELGVGIGYHDSHTYIPVSGQYNYKYNKGVQIEGHIGIDGQFKGAEIQHKWKF